MLSSVIRARNAGEAVPYSVEAHKLPLPVNPAWVQLRQPYSAQLCPLWKKIRRTNEQTTGRVESSREHQLLRFGHERGPAGHPCTRVRQTVDAAVFGSHLPVKFCLLVSNSFFQKKLHSRSGQTKPRRERAREDRSA